MIRLLVLAITLFSTPAFAQRTFAGGEVDPFFLGSNYGERADQPVDGYSNAAGKTLASSVLAAPSTTAVIITIGQSMVQNVAQGSYVVTNTGHVYNFNIYDGGLYQCANPVLGTSIYTTLGTNSPNCVIGDSLVTAGTYTDVIMVPIGIQGSTCAMWGSGALAQRIVVTMRRLASRGLTPTWILWHSGETDHVQGTPRATLAACIGQVAQAFVNNGSGSARFFVATESMVNNITSSTVTDAEADAVATGLHNIRQGADWDSLTGGTNRNAADGTHWTQTGNASAAALDVTVITNCKNVAC